MGIQTESLNIVREKRLLAFELPETLATRSLYLVMHKDYILKSYVEEFVKFVQGYYMQQER